jgi:hypothetical protein
MGPNGKIYVAKYECGYIGVINNPEAAGSLCNYVDSGLYLNGKRSLAGLPNFVQSLFLQPVNIHHKSQTNYNVFPNPFTNNISVTIPNTNYKQAIFRVKNMLGHTMFIKQENNNDCNNTHTLDLTSLSNGIYLLETNIDGKNTVSKIVKQ